MMEKEDFPDSFSKNTIEYDMEKKRPCGNFEKQQIYTY